MNCSNGNRPRGFIKRRLLMLLSITFGALLLAGAGYFLRMRQIDKRLALSRAEGMECFSRGEYGPAVHKIGAYLQRHPDDAVAVYSYAVSREHVQEPNGKHLTDAIGHLEHALSLKPDYMEARRALLDLYLQVGFSTEAIATADAILSTLPDDLSALRAKALSLSRLGRGKEAMECAQRVCQLNPTDIEAQVLLFRLMLKSDKSPADVEAYADSLLKAHPDDARFELVRSIASSIARDTAHATEWARKSLAHPIADPTFIVILGKQLDDVGLFDESLSILSRFAGSTNDPKLRRLLVMRQWQAGNYQAAIDLTANEQPSNPNADDTLLAGRAMALADLGRYAEATSVIEAMSNLHHDMADLWVPVLKAAKSGPKADDAQVIQACETAVQASPENAYFHYFLAEAYERMGEDETAVAHYRTATDLARSWAAPTIAASRALAQLNRISEALQFAQVARLRAPRNVEGLVAIGTAWNRVIMRSDAKARADLLHLTNDVQAMQPGEPQTLPIQIRLLAATEQRPEAIAKIEGILRSTPAPAEKLLLQLAAVSDEFKLGVAERCFALSEQAHGSTPDLAMARGIVLLHEGKSEQGRQAIATAAANPARVGTPRDWRLQQVRYLELIGSPDAKAAWIALGNDLPSDVPLQWQLVACASLRSDHSAVGAALDRIKAVIGDRGVTWRLSRASWLMQGSPAQSDLTEASRLLNDVIRTTSDLLLPRMMLGECLEKLGDANGAFEQFSKAANLHPESNVAQLQVARLCQARGDFSGAEPYLELVAANHNATADELRQTASMFARQGNSARALNILQKIDPSAQGNDPRNQRKTALMRASLLRSANQPEQAEAIYSDLLKTPDVPTIQAAAEFYFARGKADDAARVLNLLGTIGAPPETVHLLRADYFRRRGDVDGTFSEYRQATQAAPTNLNAWRQYISTAAAMARTDEVIAAARNANRANPADAAFQLVVGRVATIQAVANDPSARPLIGALVAEDATTRTNASAALDAIAGSGHDGKSLKNLADTLRQMADRNPRDQALQESAAIQCLASRQFDDAITLTTRAMQTFPTDPGAARLATEALAMAGRWSEVSGAAQAWRDRAPEWPVAADQMLASADLETGHFDQAANRLAPYLEQAKADPDSYEALIGLAARARLALGHLDSAGELLSPLLSRDAKWRHLWMALAPRISDKAAAAGWLRQVTPSIPKESVAEAVDMAEGWYSISSHGTEAAQNLPAFQEALGVAAERAKASADVQPQDLLRLGMMHELNKDPQSAEVAYRRALTLSPGNVFVENNLANTIGHNGGNLAEAIDLISKAIASNPNIPNFYDTLAWLQTQNKSYPQAATSMAAAVRLDPDNVSWQINLVDILLKAGDKAKARSAWKSIESREVNVESLDPEVRQRLQVARNEFQ